LLVVTPVTELNRDEILTDRLKNRTCGKGASIVYVTRQNTTETVAKMLKNNEFNAFAYHAGMNANDRKQVQEDFIASDDIIIVATIALGMGIDKADIRYVFHYNPPKNLKGYAQEVGRAGRDGNSPTVRLYSFPVIYLF